MNFKDENEPQFLAFALDVVQYIQSRAKDFDINVVESIKVVEYINALLKGSDDE